MPGPDRLPLRVGSILVALLLGSFSLACAQAPAVEARLYFPPEDGDWQTAEPGAVGWNAGRLNDALEFAGAHHSSGMVILHRGRILAERHWDLDPPRRTGLRLNRYYFARVGTDAAGHVIEDVASTQKSVVSLLTGIAQEQGLLAISDPVHKHLGVGWSKAPPEQEAAITIRHLLTMTSGLDDQLGFVAPPGNRWRYNSTAYAQILQAIAAASALEPNELTQTWLTGPIGMNDSKWIKRARPEEAGDAIVKNGMGFATTARDLARFGLLVLAEGTWDGQPVLGDRAYLQAALSPSQSLNPSYGYLWWLNGQSAVMRAGRRLQPRSLNPQAPADLVGAHGAMGRRVFVVPSLELVVTRIGDTPGAAGEESFDERLWELLLSAAPRD